MSLKKKIQESGKDACQICHEYEEIKNTYMNPNERQKLLSQKYILVDDVLSLLRDAAKQIQKIMDEDYWTANFMLNKKREAILNVLEGKTP